MAKIQTSSILKTNGFSCDGKAWGLWLTISFVNHSCAPTAHYVITQKEEGSDGMLMEVLMGFNQIFNRFAVMTGKVSSEMIYSENIPILDVCSFADICCMICE